MTYGISREDEAATISLGDKLQGFRSSTAAELVSLFGGIVAAPLTQDIIIYPEIHWASTLSILDNGSNTGSFYASTRDKSLRSHGVKKMFAVLPTQDIQHVRPPDLYTTDLCPCCKDAS